MRTPMAGGVRIGAHFNTNAYIHEETTIEFGVRISRRKYLNWCTPFSDVSQCVTQEVGGIWKVAMKFICSHCQPLK